MDINSVDSSRRRSAYERAAYVASCIMEQFQGRASEIIISQDSILTEQVIGNNISSYYFDVWDKTLQNQTPKRPLVKGVKDNDLFIAMDARLLIDSRIVGQSNVKVQTWPSPAAFFPSGATTDSLWSVYNSKWFLQVDRVVYINAELTRRFVKVPEFNYQTEASGAQGIATGYVDPLNQLMGENYVELNPYPIFSGRLDNKLWIEIPLYAGWAGAANTTIYTTTENVITFEFHGYTVKNGSQWIPFFNGQLSVDKQSDIASYTPGTNV